MIIVRASYDSRFFMDILTSSVGRGSWVGAGAGARARGQISPWLLKSWPRCNRPEPTSHRMDKTRPGRRATPCYRATGRNPADVTLIVDYRLFIPTPWYVFRIIVRFHSSAAFLLMFLCCRKVCPPDHNSSMTLKFEEDWRIRILSYTLFDGRGDLLSTLHFPPKNIFNLKRMFLDRKR